MAHPIHSHLHTPTYQGSFMCFATASFKEGKWAPLATNPIPLPPRVATCESEAKLSLLKIDSCIEQKAAHSSVAPDIRAGG